MGCSQWEAMLVLGAIAINRIDMSKLDIPVKELEKIAENIIHEKEVTITQREKIKEVYQQNDLGF